jgi:hypothetical protein
MAILNGIYADYQTITQADDSFNDYALRKDPKTSLRNPFSEYTEAKDLDPSIAKVKIHLRKNYYEELEASRDDVEETRTGPEISLLEARERCYNNKKGDSKIGPPKRAKQKINITTVNPYLTPLIREQTLKLLIKLCQEAAFKDILHDPTIPMDSSDASSTMEQTSTEKQEYCRGPREPKEKGSDSGGKSPTTTPKNRISSIKELNLYLDKDKLIRVKGRVIKNSPILLPCESHLTKLIIEKIHYNNYHPGVAITLSELRKDYWILKARPTIKRILKTCVTCNRHKARHYTLGNIQPYPQMRTTFYAPWTVVGIDYYGPLYIAKERETTGNKRKGEPYKYWVILLTCLTTRAVFCEVVKDMTTQTLINVLLCFFSIYTTPKHFISDNAKQFEVASKLFGNEDPSVFITSATWKSFLDKHSISWHFITPYSPWRGGVYERMVGLHKRCLKIALGKALLNLEQIRALIYQVSNHVNSRPLMQQLAEENQILILTPNMMIKPYTSQSIYDLDKTNTKRRLKTPVLAATGSSYQLLPEALTEIYNAIQNRLTKAILIWNTEYLNVLRERATFHHAKSPGESRDTPEVGEVVLVETPSPRGEWPLGLIVKINYFTNKEETPSNIESVVVRMKGEDVIKPLTKITPLEIKPTGEMMPSDHFPIRETQADRLDISGQDDFDHKYEKSQKDQLQHTLENNIKEAETPKIVFDPPIPMMRSKRLAAHKARQNIAETQRPKHRTQRHLSYGTKLSITFGILSLVFTTSSSATLSWTKTCQTTIFLTMNNFYLTHSLPSKYTTINLPKWKSHLPSYPTNDHWYLAIQPKVTSTQPNTVPLYDYSISYLKTLDPLQETYGQMLMIKIILIATLIIMCFGLGIIFLPNSCYYMIRLFNHCCRPGELPEQHPASTIQLDDLIASPVNPIDVTPILATAPPQSPLTARYNRLISEDPKVIFRFPPPPPKNRDSFDSIRQLPSNSPPIFISPEIEEESASTTNFRLNSALYNRRSELSSTSIQTNSEPILLLTEEETISSPVKFRRNIPPDVLMETEL